MKRPGEVALDVRGVAPKDRFELIMGTYRSLAPGEILELTVDHDPSCMYYTLLAEEGEDTFEFAYLERGPVSWTVRIRKGAGVPA